MESPSLCFWLVMCDCTATLCFATVLGFNRLCNWLVCRNSTTLCGKIQGEVRKFLHRFRSYFGSQISTQPLNEVHIYRLQPKSATKGEFFSCIFVFDCFESASQIANGEGSRRIKKLRQLKTHENVLKKMQSQNVES